MNQIQLDYLAPQKKKTSRLARLGLLCAIAPYFLCCGVMIHNFGDETPFITNRFQDAALTLGFLGLPITAVVLGVLALRQIKRNPLWKGKGLAYAALIIGSLCILLMGIATLLYCLGVE